MKSNIKSLILLVIAMQFHFLNSKAQQPTVIVDSLNFHFCGYSANPSTYGAKGAAPFIPQAVFPTSLIVTCGNFRVYYEDDYVAATTSVFDGFAAPVVGAQRKNTFCAVLTYLQNTLDMNGQTIDIFVQRSYAASFPAPVGTIFFANAGPYYTAPYGTAPGFFGGDVYDHILTGTDPDPNYYDARVHVNFDATYPSSLYQPISYWDDYTNTTTPCSVDLYTVLLHEMLHAFGWGSALDEDATPNYYLTITSNNSNIQSFTKFDQLFLYAGDVRNPATFTGNKLIQGGVLNPALASTPNVLRINQVWMTNNGTPRNHKALSYVNPNVFGLVWPRDASLSHMDLTQFSFYDGHQHSPGYQPFYVMGPDIQPNERRRVITLAELRYLRQLGYNYNPTFAASTSLSGGSMSNANLLNNNIAPVRSNVATTNLVSWPMTTNTQFLNGICFAETKPVDFTITNNNAPGGGIATVFTINTNTLINVADGNGESIGIYPNSLYGIRGVTTGGNNHNAIVVTGSNIITYTPPPGYVGRAEFYFQLWDGKEAGGYKTITIDVLPGAFVIPVGNELVINSGFEDASELTTVSNQTIASSTFFNGDQRFQTPLNCAMVYPGAKPYCYALYSFGRLTGGVSKKESFQSCRGGTVFASGTKAFGSSSTTFGTYLAGTGIYSLQPDACPTVPNSENHLYTSSFESRAHIHTLMNDLKTCKNYRFEFDATFSGANHAVGNVYTFTLNAVSGMTPDINFGATSLSLVSFNIHQAIPFTFTVTGHSPNVTNTNWQHIVVDFFYCGTPTRYINLLTYSQDMAFDNVSLKELSTPPPPLIITATNSSTLFCPGSTATLTGNALNTLCSLTYTWLPMGITSPSVVVTPPTINTTYTLLGNDGCRTGSAIVTPVPAPSGSLANGAPVCIGSFATYSLQSLIPSGMNPNGNFTGTAINNLNCSGSMCSYIDLTGGIGIYPPGVYNYTYSIIDASGCTQSYTFNVMFVSPTTNSITSNPSTCIAAGQQVTLTASPFPAPGTTYTWQPTGSSSGSIVVTPTVSTTYTLLSENSVCLNQHTINVTVVPTISFVNPPTQICTYQSINQLESYLAAATPTGGTWSSPSGLGTFFSPSPGITNLNVNPALTPLGTHTVTYCYSPPTNTACIVCNSFTINVGAGFSLNGSPTQNYCANIPNANVTVFATATPSTGVSYLWQPGSLPSQSIVVSPTSTTIYTVTATSGFCTFTATSQVNTLTNCCTAAQYINTAVLTNTVLPPNSYAINSDITISGVTNFAGSELKIAPNVKITVANGGAFIIRNCHIYACNDMWNGIVINNGGRIECFQNSLIEDAVTAIKSASSTNVNPPNPDIAVFETIFNKNLTAIEISNYTANTTNPPFQIYSNIFTSRSLTFTANSWPSAASSGAGLRTMTGNTVQLPSPYTLQNFPAANLKAPFSSMKSSIGVFLQNCGTISQPTNLPPVYTSILIGNTGAIVRPNIFNLFDNLYFGIYAKNANVQSYANTFQNIGRGSYIGGGGQQVVYGGYGIYSTHDSLTASNNYLSIKHPSSPTNGDLGNWFYDCYVGVGLQSVLTADIRYGEFKSSQTIANPPTNTLNISGAAAITYYGNRSVGYLIENNKIRNHTNGIRYHSSNGTLNIPSLGNYGRYLSDIKIRFNEMTANATATTAPSVTRIGLGVYAAYLPLINGALHGNGQMQIEDNRLIRVHRGVEVTGWKNANYKAAIKSNTISMVNDAYTPTLPQYGVKVTDCRSNIVTTNSIIANNVTNTLITGVYHAMNVDPQIQCNQVNTLYTAFEFAGSNTGTYWRDNTMSNAKRGLNMTNSAIIGAQGNTNQPSDNKWNGTWTGTNYHTFTDTTIVPTSSPLYVRTTAGYFPINNSNQFSFASLTYFLAPNTVFNANNNASILNCTTLGGGGGGGGGGGSAAAQLNLLNDVATDNITYTANVIETKEINKNLLYETISATPTLAIASPTLAAFYVNNQSTSREVYNDVVSALSSGNFVQTDALLMGFNPATNIEQNYKTYYSLSKKIAAELQLTAQDESDLLVLAHQCPFIDGTVVYEARTLLNYIHQKAYQFNDNTCANTGFSFGRTNNGNQQSEDELNAELLAHEKRMKEMYQKESMYLIFPNPATEELTILSVNASEKVDMSIQDVNGKTVYKTTLSNTQAGAKLNLDLLNGVYFINLVDENRQRTIKKLVIAK